jgi:hypothetical protein
MAVRSNAAAEGVVIFRDVACFIVTTAEVNRAIAPQDRSLDTLFSSLFGLESKGLRFQNGLLRLLLLLVYVRQAERG